MALRRVVSAQRAHGASRLMSTLSGKGKYIQWEVKNGIAVATFDDPDSKVNTLHSGLTDEITDLLNNVETSNDIKAVILRSGKPGNFIAGADITVLQTLDSVEAAEKVVTGGHQIMDRIAKSKKPFVAAIDGQCMGGGLEVALACHYRIATSNKKTALSLPEVQLGLLPGAGGTQRLPQLVGIQTGLDMMLTGKTIRPDKAKKMGLVDSVCDPTALDSAAMQAAVGLADGSVKKAAPKKKSLVNRILEDTPLRSIVFKKATEMMMKASGGNYPAPKAILKCVEEGVTNGHAAGQKAEIREFSKLTQTPEAASLISLFFGMNALKKNPYGEPKVPVKTVGVLGAGLMGAGIAQVSVNKGYDVLMKDVDAKGVNRGVAAINKAFDLDVKKKKTSRFEADTILSHLTPLTDSDNWKPFFKKADVVIEAVPESLGLKHKVIQAMEEVVPEHCVIATNTSAIPIAEIAKGSKRPERVLGMHYFSPVDKMMLLEIIPHAGTDKDVLAAAAQVGIKQGKIILPCKDVPGFYINRSLGPYMAECVALLQAGVEPHDLDKALKSFGFPVGPIELVDEVGLDVGSHVQETLSGDLGVRMEGGNREALQSMVDAGFLGRKSEKGGFYLYPKKKAKGPKPINEEAKKLMQKYITKKDIPKEDLALRMAGRFANEAAFCLQDEIITNPHHGDVAAVFGIGFPPFRGGPFRWIDSLGVGNFVSMMQRFEEKNGAQFTPAPLLVDMAKANKKFHSK